MRISWLLPLITASLVACQDAGPLAPDSTGTPLFKPKCDSPPCNGGGEDPPPPPPPSNVEPHVLFSSHLEGATGGGGCKRGDLSWSVYRMDLNGAFERVFGDDLESQSASLYPSFSPNGQSFSFYRDVYTVAKGRCATEHFQVATSNVDGTGLTIIREIERGSGGLSQPGWSPGPVDGAERIAWLEWSSGAYSPNVVIARTDGTDRSTVVQRFGNYEIEGFEWSRTGHAILVNFRDWDADVSLLRLYSVSCSPTCGQTGYVDLGDLSPTPPSSWFADMSWARQNDWIALPACGGGTCELWKIDLSDPASPVITRLTANGLDEQEVSWSPDDSKLLFTAWPVDGTRMAIELDPSATTLPWDGDLGAPGVRVLADVGNSWGTDWRRF